MVKVANNDYANDKYDEAAYDKGMKLYYVSTRNAYETNRKTISGESLPSSYMLQKCQYKVEAISLIQDFPFGDTTDYLLRATIDLDKCDALMRMMTLGFGNIVIGAKIAGDYASYLPHMATKHFRTTVS